MRLSQTAIILIQFFVVSSAIAVTAVEPPQVPRIPFETKNIHFSLSAVALDATEKTILEAFFQELRSKGWCKVEAVVLVPTANNSERALAHRRSAYSAELLARRGLPKHRIYVSPEIERAESGNSQGGVRLEVRALR